MAALEAASLFDDAALGERLAIEEDARRQKAVFVKDLDDAVYSSLKNDAVRMSVCEAFASALESIDGSLECIIVKAIIEQSDNQSVRQSMVETLAVRGRCHGRCALRGGGRCYRTTLLEQQVGCKLANLFPC